MFNPLPTFLTNSLILDMFNLLVNRSLGLQYYEEVSKIIS